MLGLMHPLKSHKIMFGMDDDDEACFDAKFPGGTSWFPLPPFNVMDWYILLKNQK